MTNFTYARRKSLIRVDILSEFSPNGLRNEISTALNNYSFSKNKKNEPSIFNFTSKKPNKSSVHIVQTRANLTSTMLVHHSAFKSSKLIRAINASGYSDWLRYCYGDNCLLGANLLTVLLCLVKEKINRRLQKKTLDILAGLCALACLRKKQIHLNLKSFSQREIAELFCISTQTWKRRWSSYWNLLIVVIDDYDLAGLKRVHESTSTRKASAMDGGMSLLGCFPTWKGKKVFTRVEI